MTEDIQREHVQVSTRVEARNFVAGRAEPSVLSETPCIVSQTPAELLAMPPDYTEERLEPMEDEGCTTFLPLDAPPPKKKIDAP